MTDSVPSDFFETLSVKSLTFDTVVYPITETWVTPPKTVDVVVTFFCTVVAELFIRLQGPQPI